MRSRASARAAAEAVPSETRFWTRRPRRKTPRSASWMPRCVALPRRGAKRWISRRQCTRGHDDVAADVAFGAQVSELAVISSRIGEELDQQVRGRALRGTRQSVSHRCGATMSVSAETISLSAATTAGAAHAAQTIPWRGYRGDMLTCRPTQAPVLEELHLRADELGGRFRAMNTTGKMGHIKATKSTASASSSAPERKDAPPHGRMASSRR